MLLFCRDKKNPASIMRLRP